MKLEVIERRGAGTLSRYVSSKGETLAYEARWPLRDGVERIERDRAADRPRAALNRWADALDALELGAGF